MKRAYSVKHPFWSVDNGNTINMFILLKSKLYWIAYITKNNVVRGLYNLLSHISLKEKSDKTHILLLACGRDQT